MASTTHKNDFAGAHQVGHLECVASRLERDAGQCHPPAERHILSAVRVTADNVTAVSASATNAPHTLINELRVNIVWLLFVCAPCAHTW